MPTIATYFDLLVRLALITFDQNEIARAKLCDDLGTRWFTVIQIFVHDSETVR